MCLLVPYRAIKGYLKLLKSEPIDIPRRKLYIRTIFGPLVLTAFACVIAWEVGMVLFRPWVPDVREIGSGLALLFGWFLLREWMVPWLRKTAPPNSLVRMPISWRQLSLWTVVSVVAGVGEEIIYRGVLFNCVLWYSHSIILSAIICSVAFGIAHLGQGPRSAGFITCLALTFHWLVWIAGSLYMAMLVHATFDFAVGLRYVLLQQKADREFKAGLESA